MKFHQPCEHQFNMTFSAQNEEIMENMWNVLASLAVFVEQAKQDERYLVLNSKDSFNEQIINLQEENIYNMLCALKVRVVESRSTTTEPMQRNISAQMYMRLLLA